MALCYLLISNPNAARKGLWALESHARHVRRMKRRRLGAAILAAACIAVFFGANFMEPAKSPLGYTMFWIGVLVLALWLLAIALADLIQTRQLIKRIRDKRSDRADENARCQRP